MTDASKLAESLRAMRRNAAAHWSPHGQMPRYAITMDSTRLGDLTDAADLIERQAAELAELRGTAVVASAGADDPHLSARFEVTR